jgi:hypothetical protein
MHTDIFLFAACTVDLTELICRYAQYTHNSSKAKTLDFLAKHFNTSAAQHHNAQPRILPLTSSVAAALVELNPATRMSAQDLVRQTCSHLAWLASTLMMVHRRWAQINCGWRNCSLLLLQGRHGP